MDQPTAIDSIRNSVCNAPFYHGHFRSDKGKVFKFKRANQLLRSPLFETGGSTASPGAEDGQPDGKLFNFPVKTTDSRVPHATVLSSERPSPNTSVSDKSMKRIRDMSTIIENQRRKRIRRSRYVKEEQNREEEERKYHRRQARPIKQSNTREIYATSSNNRDRSARWIDPTRRIIRSMSASQHLRVNAFMMKPAATIPILSGTNKENFQENELEKQNSQAILRTKPPVYPMDTAEREQFCEDFSNKFEENGTFPKIPQNT
uniref:Uncharacterized protein n=1 Tax=Caenorhabditis japonica TaxID=281687 RepID=A0A8R1IFE2_CAEJA